VGAEQAADCLPFARVAVVLEAFADPAQKVVGEHADDPKNWEALRQTAVRRPEGCRSREAKASTCGRDAVFELMEIRPQSERAFKLGKAGFGLEQCHVELSELRGSEALVGLQNIVAALGEGVFHFVLVAGHFEPSGAVFERAESH